MQKGILLLLVAAAYTVSAGPAVNDATLEQKEYQRFVEFPDGDEVGHIVDLEEEPDMELLDQITRNPANNGYMLYTRRNPDTAQALEINDAGSILRSNFNPHAPTVVVAHGWLSNEESNLNPTIRDAYLQKDDVNVIILDWRRLAVSNYISSVRGVPAVGRGLGQFLAFLNQVTGAPFNKMHLIGFSLGAHLVGNAGRELNGQVARITALDPAGPLWTFNSNRVNSNDAIYVEGIHTDDDLGLNSDIGDVDFYPNGGNSQRGCLTPICNHNRAWRFFAASVTYNHLVGNQCGNRIQLRLNRCRGQELHMGNDDLNKTGAGVFRVNTRMRYPY